MVAGGTGRLWFEAARRQAWDQPHRFGRCKSTIPCANWRRLDNTA
jgi:hypothetical protein